MDDIRSMIETIKSVSERRAPSEELAFSFMTVDHTAMSEYIRTRFDTLLDQLIRLPRIHLEVSNSESVILQTLELPKSAREYSGVPLSRVIQNLDMLLSELDTALESSRSTTTPCPSEEASGEANTSVTSHPAESEDQSLDDSDSGLFVLDP
jgi:hypothetical protein